MVATVAVCLLVPRLLGSPSTAPDPIDRPPGPDDWPTGQVVRSAPVWAGADGLHLGNRVLDLAFDSQSASCGIDPVCSPFTSLALVGGGVVYGDHESHRVWYQPQKGPVRLIGEGSEVGPAGDPDGSTAAWFDGAELVMFDTATGTGAGPDHTGVSATAAAGERPRQPDHGGHVRGSYLARQRENHFDRLSGTMSEMPGIPGGGVGGVDVHAGRLARQNDAGVTEVVSPAGDTTLKLKPGQLLSPMRFNADGRYLAGIRVEPTYGATIADTHIGEFLIPSRKDAYPWIGWGYGDTLMVIQDSEGTNDNNPFDKSQLLACDVSEPSCQRLDRKGVITLPSG